MVEKYDTIELSPSSHYQAFACNHDNRGRLESKIFFHWQNPALLRTIYPLREMKLRDFLYYYHEIDLWKEYKDKSLDDLAGEVRAHHAEQARIARESVARLTRLLEYFLTPDVSQVYQETYPEPDETELRKINLIHASFAKYFVKLNHPRKEKYFITQQVLLYEPRRGELTKQIDYLQRRYNAMLPDHPSRPGVLAELEKTKTVALPMAENEYNQLRELLSAHTALEPRKLEIAKARDVALFQQKSWTQKLDQNLARRKPLETQRSAAKEDLDRLNNPPQLAALERYFETEDVSDMLQETFPGLGAAQVKFINSLHKELKTSFQYTKSIAPKLNALKNYIYRLQQEQRAVDRQIKQLETSIRNMGSTWKHRAKYEADAQALRDAQPAFTEEISKLNGYWSALNATAITPSDRDRLVREKEADISKLDAQLKNLAAEESDLQARLQEVEAVLNIPEPEQLLKAVPTRPLTVRDIVRGKLQVYQAELAQKDQFELLEDIVRRFISEPARYPLWLQYMVIHFSGMRYQSAHGSWADPRELLANLRASAAEKEFKGLTDEARDAILEQKLLFYGASEDQKVDEKLALAISPLTKATSTRWKEKVDRHVRALKNPSAFHRRKALFALLVDEANYSVENLSNDEVLQALEEMKDDLPGWMWKEIVRVTSLKLKYVEDEDWETLNARDQAEKADYRWQEYRQMVSKWREAGTTAWREAHDDSNRLIVTRAVCNETAEHIQHIRGNSPPGGLTARPKWYQSLESAAAGKPSRPGEKKPHLITARKAEDFTPGASILWLTFVNQMPHAWSIARPLTLKSGEGLLPAQLYGGGQEGGWVYQNSGSVISRRRTLFDEKKRKTGMETQYLRWLHEATVVEVAETADGTVVLTFETARPNDDRRLSSVGTFKHHLDNLVYKIGGNWFNPTFIGYTPEGDVPSEDLEFMLDWNKILLRDVLSPDELQAYKKQNFYR